MRCNELVKITVSERPKRVTVEFRGRTHSARWNDQEEVFEVQGDRDLCRGALYAWSGQPHFELSWSELQPGSNGWLPELPPAEL